MRRVDDHGTRAEVRQHVGDAPLGGIRLPFELGVVQRSHEISQSGDGGPKSVELGGHS